MPLIQIDHLQGSYYPVAFQFASSRCINVYPHTPKGAKAKTQGALYSTPGKKIFEEVIPNDGAGCRGTHRTAKGRAFWVYGNTLYEQTTGGMIEKATIETSENRLSMTDNGLVLNILDGQEGYFFNLETEVIEKITDPNFPKTCTKVVYIDSYLIWCADGTDFFYISKNNASDANDCTNGDRGRADNAADIIVTAVRRGDDVIFFGTENIEVWYNSGNPAFPFERNKSALYQIGCGAAESVQEIGGNVYFLGGGRVGYGAVYELAGYTISEVSTDDISERSQQTTFLTDSYGAQDQHEGNKFYILTIPAFDQTLCYDMIRRRWHERGRLKGNGQFGREFLSHTVFFNNKQYVSDFTNNTINEYSRDYATDNGETIPREIVLPHIFTQTERIRVNAIYVDVQKGKGEINGTEAETNPRLYMHISKDGGATYISYDYKEVGATGVYTGRLQWNRVGQARDILPRLYYTGRTTFELLGVYAKVSK